MKSILFIILAFVFACPVSAQDADSDGIVLETCICTPVDNCPDIYNPDQGDCDSDGIGNECDETDGCIDTDVDTEIDTAMDTETGVDTDTGEVWNPDSDSYLSEYCEPIPGNDVFWDMSSEVISNVTAIYNLGLSYGNQSDVFAICGDSHSATPSTSTRRYSYFMGQCEPTWTNRDLNCNPEIDKSVLAFSNGNAGGVSSFSRYSVAASGGWKSSWLVSYPELIQQEVAEIAPFAVLIMFGTNDAQLYEAEDTDDIATVVDNIIEVADTWAAQGVVPIILSPPVRYDKIEVMEIMADDLRIAAGLAAYPFVDFHAVTELIPGYGLRSETSVHLTGVWNEKCCMTSDCASGDSYHHKVSLIALDRVYDLITQ